MQDLKLYSKLKSKINSFMTLKWCQKTINFLNKENYKKIKLLIAVFITFIVSVLFEMFMYPGIIEFVAKPIDDLIGTYDYEIVAISKQRIVLFWLIFYFIALHFILKLKDIYEFIYKHRYIISGIFLVTVMILKLHGSSVIWYTNLLANTDESKAQELVGMSRFIRSDEYATQTMYILSQTEGENKLQYFDNKLRGTVTDMFSLVSAPVKDIVMVGEPFLLGFLIFDRDTAFSFYWYARIIAMILGSFELCMILTNKNKKISLLGAITISFSSAVQWWYCMDTLIWGQIILVLINKFMETDKKYIKYLCAVGLLSSVLAYIFVLYPAWQVSFAYVFLVLFVWILVKNLKSNYKFTVHDITVIMVTIIGIIAILLRWYNLSHETINAIMSTKYPGNRVGTGGGIKTIFSYFYNVIFPYIYFPNPCEYATMLSYFPIPIIVGIVYLIKNKKKDLFLYLSLGVSAFLGIYCFVGFPKILAKITLLSMSISERVEIPLATLSIYMYVYILSRIKDEDKLLCKKMNIIITIITIVCLIISGICSEQFEYMNIVQIIVLSVVFYIVIYNLLAINKEKSRKVFFIFTIALALIGGIFVNPISQGTGLIYEKPISYAIQNIVSQDPNGVWVVDNMSWMISNYLVANGASTLTSTGVYPNLELYENLFGEDAQKYEEMYNRYHHIELKIVKTESKIELKSEDSIEILLNYNDVQKLGIDYILTRKNLKIEIPEMNVEEIDIIGSEIIYKVIY